MNSFSRLRDINVSVPVDTGGGSSFAKVAVMAGLAETLDLKTFIEIGVYRGRSFFPLAWSFGERGGHSYGIDPYTRADALENDLPPESADIVNEFFQKTDYDKLYHEVVQRQVHLDLHRCSTIIRQTSQAAVEIFAGRDQLADMIHIDGNHDTVFVMADVKDYIPLLKEGGVLVLDDINWDSVKPALAYASERLTLIHQAETFAVLMNGKPGQGTIVRLADECRKIEDEARTVAAGTSDRPVPTVSVSIITYNQERYIAQAIESALEQITNFPFEIVIGEDCSTDRTREICLQYQKKHPSIIRLIERNRNVGAVRNYLDNYKLCEGRYVAFLEGDDFWLDPHKLQRQVDFLDANADYAICCHDVYVADEVGNIGELLLPHISDTSTVHDLVKTDYIATASCMVRNGLIRPIPSWLYDLPGCDWPFDILNAEHGMIKFMPEPMAAYRRHSASIWSSLDGTRQKEVAIELMVKINRGLEYRYDADFKKSINDLRQSIAYREQTTFEQSIRAEMESLRSETFVGVMKRAQGFVGGVFWVVRNDPWSLPGRALGKMRNLTPPSLRPYGRRIVEFGRTLQNSAVGRHDISGPLKTDLVVLDNAYPHPQSAFRLEEFDVYLEHFKNAKVLTTGAAFYFFKPLRTKEEVISSHARQNRRFRNRVRVFDRSEEIEAKLAYMVFAGNAWENIEFVEKNNIPFVFSLYPGGSFLINDAASDGRLGRVLNSPLFRGVIVTQQITMDYLLEKQLCPPEKIHLIYGVVTPRVNLRRAPVKRLNYGFGKKTLDICFTAHKYMPDGHDKGYDIFLEVARKLVARFPECRFHVVGGFEADDLPIDGLEGKITFYGGQESDWFADFYRDKDLILLCNVPFVLLDGAFDGFPTGCGSDAMLHELALFCTDPLNLNSKFEDGRDLVIVPHEADTIAEKIAWYHDNPDALRAVGRQGARAARDVYSFEAQMEPRLRILRAEMERERSAATGDRLSS